MPALYIRFARDHCSGYFFLVAVLPIYKSGALVLSTTLTGL
jgi:hypothetical protein